MKPYRFISVQVVDVDRHGNSKVDHEWSIDLTSRAGVGRFTTKGCPYSGIDQVFKWIADRIVRL